MGRRVQLDVIEVVEPCEEDWDAMLGAGAVRFCELCRMNVYNLSEMTADEASSILERDDGRLCVRFYRRADGTVTTVDCAPARFEALRRAARRSLSFAAASLAGLLALIGGLSAVLLGSREEEPCPTPIVTAKAHVAPPPPPMMPLVEVPSPPPEPEPAPEPEIRHIRMGRVAPSHYRDRADERRIGEHDVF